MTQETARKMEDFIEYLSQKPTEKFLFFPTDQLDFWISERNTLILRLAISKYEISFMLEVYLKDLKEIKSSILQEMNKQHSEILQEDCIDVWIREIIERFEKKGVFRTNRIQIRETLRSIIKLQRKNNIPNIIHGFLCNQKVIHECVRDENDQNTVLLALICDNSMFFTAFYLLDYSCCMNFLSLIDDGIVEMEKNKKK